MTEFLKSFTSSGLASTIVYPVDLLKTQFQVNQINRATGLTVPGLAKNIYRTQGVRGFFRGLPPHLMTYPIFWATYFQVNELNLKPFDVQYPNKVVNALLSAGVASTVANPLFVLKTRLQTDILNNKPVYNNYVGSVRNILATEGVRSLFKGLGTTIGSNTKLALQFPFYDYLKDNGYNTFTASILSKTTVSTLFYPADLIRTNQRDTTSRLSFVDAAKKTYRSRGIFGLYRGVLLYNLMTGPNFVLMMVFKDWLEKLL